MDTIGIICEYNPFHNGHIYHLNKVKEMFPNSLIILVMSGNFTQRGIPSILNKWDKTEIALEYGIDLVIELPFVFATQGADIFAKGTISILKELKANYLVFGSESNNIEHLEELVKISFNDNYQNKVKELLDQGYNYPTALNKAFGNDVNIDTPNDLLAFSYIKEIIKQEANIKPISIKRTNSYHDTKINSDISSATSIRKAIEENKEYQNSIPEITIEKLKNNTYIQEEYFKYLKYKILSTSDLSIYQTVDEGIENRIKKYILEASNWDDLVLKIKTKRYTYNKINRMLTHILCSFTKEEANLLNEIEYIRILGFNNKGKKYLNKIKKDVNTPIITNFKNNKSKMLEIELRSSYCYYSILEEDLKNKLIKEEYQNKPKMKDN